MTQLSEQHLTDLLHKLIKAKAKVKSIEADLIDDGDFADMVRLEEANEAVLKILAEIQPYTATANIGDVVQAGKAGIWQVTGFGDGLAQLTSHTPKQLIEATHKSLNRHVAFVERSNGWAREEAARRQPQPEPIVAVGAEEIASSVGMDVATIELEVA